MEKDYGRATLAEAALRGPTDEDLIARAERGRRIREGRERKEKLSRFRKLALYDLASLGSAGYGAYLLGSGDKSGAFYIGLGLAAKIIEYRKLWRSSR